MMPQEEVLLKIVQLYHPTVDQQMIHNSAAAIRILACGRRWGKNFLALNDMMKKSWEHPGSITWWTSPVLRQAKRDFRRFIQAFKPAIKKISQTELRIELNNGEPSSIIEFHSLHDPDNLLGEGLDYLYMDEAARVKENTFDQVLSPMLLDRNGSVLMFSTPKGKNWFYRMFELGQQQANNIKSWRFSTRDNPFITPEAFEEEYQRLPAQVADQEYDAQFIDDSSLVFRGYLSCIDGEIEAPKVGRVYRMGVDLGKHQDYTVCTVIDLKSRHIVAWDRFNQKDWAFIKSRIQSLCYQYNRAEILLDSTGVGDSVYDDLIRMGLPVQGYRFTLLSKTQLIENLILRIANKEITFPAIPELLKELELFSYTKLPSGSVRYSAPPGFHDDCVISLALAVMDLNSSSHELSILLGGEREIS